MIPGGFFYGGPTQTPAAVNFRGGGLWPVSRLDRPSTYKYSIWGAEFNSTMVLGVHVFVAAHALGDQQIIE